MKLNYMASCHHGRVAVVLGLAGSTLERVAQYSITQSILIFISYFLTWYMHVPNSLSYENHPDIS